VKISVITWDCSFREKFHTVDSFGNQNYPKDQYEFIWVDFYENKNSDLIERIDSYSNARLLNLGHSGDVKWHLGTCLNEGIKQARGEILVLPDGDVVVPRDLLTHVEEEHHKVDKLALYFRRWDELAKTHHPQNSYSLDYLEDSCELLNSTNYAGTLSIKKRDLESVNGYEESSYFAGAGAIAFDLYLRIRNSAFYVKWDSKKVYHPYHSSTGSSDKYKKELELLSKKYKWIKPYCGIEQSWILHRRETDLDTKASEEKVHQYISTMPELFIDYKQEKGIAAMMKQRFKKVLNV
jgi:hypothetical protein